MSGTPGPRTYNSPMTAFVESCVETVADSASAVARRSRDKPLARHLLKQLAGKRNILVTSHENPDPDALASSLALSILLDKQLPDVKVSVALKGNVGGGMNEMFVQLTNLKPIPWDESTLGEFDAIILVDVQPNFTTSPLPAEFPAMAVIDHHRRLRGRRPKCAFCDVRPDVGATSSIIFSYFMELEQPISRDLGAALLFAIESDLAGAAGQPGELDNVALSSLTLIADPRKLYKMRYAELPQSHYIAYAQGLGNAVYYENVLLSSLATIDSPEKAAVIADFLLRFDQVKWALVTAVYKENLVLSLRTSHSKASAADLMRKLVRKLGEGGGHGTKAGGAIPLQSGTPAELERLHTTLRRRYLRGLNIPSTRGQRLIPKPDSTTNAR